jgi:hypothetical protein
MAHLRIIFLITVPLAAAAIQPGFARDSNVHGTSKHASHAMKDANRKTNNAKGGISVETPAKDTSGGPNVAPPHPALTMDKSRSLDANPKINSPVTPPVRRVMVPESSPLVRNSIGQPVVPHDSRPIGADRVGPAIQGPAPHQSSGSTQTGGPSLPREIPHPVATASVPGRDKIDGTALIRPALAPSSLGGPAKVATGINGSNFRRKY